MAKKRQSKKNRCAELICHYETSHCEMKCHMKTVHRDVPLKHMKYDGSKWVTEATKAPPNQPVLVQADEEAYWQQESFQPTK